MYPRASGWFRRPLILFLLLPLAMEGADASSQLRPWRDYHVIMWVGDSAYKEPAKMPLFFQRLREMGVDTAMVFADGDPQPLLDNHFAYYVENLVNKGLCLKFSSNVRDWDKFVTQWSQSGRPESALTRDYCLEDPAWRGWARERMQQGARKNKANHPLAYNIRDELSVTYSANPFDYDFNPIALAAFRDWLRAQYHDLAGLNAEWETQFKSWDEVKPFTTDQIKNRMASGDAIPRGQPDWQALEALKYDAVTARKNPTRWNLSPWADFRTFQDISLANTLADLRDAAHGVDPQTPVGIEGAQMPSAFGGYDLWRLSQALDWVEPYDIGDSREIFGSFMPGKQILTTVFESDTGHASRRLWHLLLGGDRACIIWWSEDCIDWKSPDYALTPKAKALVPVLKELRGPLAQLFLRAEPVRDPVFIHYSQASVQVDWLLESTVDGSTWLRRFSSFEGENNRQARVRDGWLKAFQDLGFAPEFVSSEQIESGRLKSLSSAVLVLPSSYALSGREASEITAFLDHPSGNKTSGRAVFCDGVPGAFDEHGKLRETGGLENFFPASTVANSVLAHREKAEPPAIGSGDIGRYSRERLSPAVSAKWSDWLQRQLEPLHPEITVTAGAHVRIHRFQAGRSRLIAFERNIEYQMSEDLKQAGGNEALEKPIELDATLSRPGHVFDLRAQKYLGRTDRIHFTLDPWRPSLYAITEERLPEETIVQALAREVEK
ncbi:MAG: beta-galactosidase [Limisphaerales bacterium]